MGKQMDEVLPMSLPEVGKAALHAPKQVAYQLRRALCTSPPPGSVQGLSAQRPSGCAASRWLFCQAFLPIPVVCAQ